MVLVFFKLSYYVPSFRGWQLFGLRKSMPSRLFGPKRSFNDKCGAGIGQLSFTEVSDRGFRLAKYRKQQLLSTPTPPVTAASDAADAALAYVCRYAADRLSALSAFFCEQVEIVRKHYGAYMKHLGYRFIKK